MTMIDKCGSYATPLVRVVTTALTGKDTTSMGLRFVALDLDACGALFGGEDAFGALDMFVRLRWEGEPGTGERASRRERASGARGARQGPRGC